ncbi:MAG: SufD family Fe-S cluster assembly protein [Arcobacter sp.]|nr:SufD family Fe-S cluster assembly protein [Arcobacter sp.]
MQIANLNLNLPQKKEEEFLKIDFTSLFDFDFKEHKTLNFALDLESIKDDEVYDSKLFSIANSFDNSKRVLTISENLEKPLIIVNKLKNSETLYTNNLLINVKEGVKASVIEVFTSNLNNSTILANRTIEVEKKEVNYELNGLNKLRNSANSSTLVKTTHNNQSSRSNINYKNSLLDKSRAVVKIRSIVTQTGLYSKAFQNCNSILLSDDAVIFAQPFLEIFIDELEASHGTTTGTLNKEQLLYLQARGISKEKSYEMLLEAFENSIKNNIKDEKIKEFLEEYKKESFI